MATFSHGASARVLFNGYDLSSYFRDAGTPVSAETAETTAFGDTSKTYIAGLKEGAFNASGMYDSTAAASDEVLEGALGDNDSEISYYPEGHAIGKYGFGLKGIETSYETVSPVDGVNAVSVEAISCTGGERIVSQQALGATSASGTAVSVNGGAATTDGFVGYLHVTARNGGTLDVKFQDSANDSTWADITGASFTQVTAGTVSERIEGTADVRQYTRCVWTLTGSGTLTWQAGLGRSHN